MARQSIQRRCRLAVEALEKRATPAVFIVTSPIDSGAGTLRDMVAAANASPGHDVIRFEIPSLQPGPLTITLTSGEIAISDSLTVIGTNFGPSTVPPVNAIPMINVSGNHSSRIFNINGPGALLVNVYGLGFVNGKTTASGGALLNVGEFVTLTSCTFTNNTAVRHGGAIESFGATTTVTNIRPGVALNYCRLVGNRATDGGAVHLTALGSLAVYSSTFDANRSIEEGGAISLPHGGRLTIESSTLSNNTAGTSGGGLHFVGGPNSGTFSNAAGLQLLVRNSTVSGNDAGVSGGGMALAGFTQGAAVIANSTVTDNAAGETSPILTSTGGGINVVPASNTTTVGRVSLISSVLSGNRAGFGPDAFTPGSLGAAYSAVGNPSGIAHYVDGGTNLPFGIDLKLGPLANNGGPTLTHMPAADSPLINRGRNPYLLRFDQRGFRRVVGLQADIGAVERGPSTVPVVSPKGRGAPIDGDGLFKDDDEDR